MSTPVETHQSEPYFTIDDFKKFALTWTPRALFAGLAGYYCLGIAYDVGLMAAIDQVAISVFKHYFGYAGIGAFMPSFQWYSAWGVRIVSAALGGLLYDLAERMVICISKAFKTEKPVTNL